MESAFHSGGNYYTLVYSPIDRNWNGGYRKIVVRTASGTKYTLNYRRGYYADDPYRKNLNHDSTAATKSATASIDPLNAAMQRGAPEPTQIIFKALIVPTAQTGDKLTEGSAAAPKTKPPYRTFSIYLAGNPNDFELRVQPDGSRVSAVRFATAVYDHDGQTVTLYSRNAQATVTPADYQQMQERGMQFREQISVPVKGEYFLRIGVKDNYSGKVGAIEVPVSVIPADKPAAATK